MILNSGMSSISYLQAWVHQYLQRAQGNYAQDYTQDHLENIHKREILISVSPCMHVCMPVHVRVGGRGMCT